MVNVKLICCPSSSAQPHLRPQKDAIAGARAFAFGSRARGGTPPILLFSPPFGPFAPPLLLPLLASPLLERPLPRLLLAAFGGGLSAPVHAAPSQSLRCHGLPNLSHGKVCKDSSRVDQTARISP